MSAPTIPPEELQKELERTFGRPGVGAAESIRLASRMTAALVTDRESIVTLKDPADQAIDLSEGTTWRWTVTPKVDGAMLVTATLSAPVTVNGRESSYRIKSFEKTVTVSVTASDRIADLLTWANENWAILAAAAAGLAALFEWLRRRTKRKRPAGFRT